MQINGYDAVITLHVSEGTKPATQVLHFGGPSKLKREDLPAAVAKELTTQLAVLGGHGDLEGEIKGLKNSLAKMTKKADSASEQVDSLVLADKAMKQQVKAETKADQAILLQAKDIAEEAKVEMEKTKKEALAMTERAEEKIGKALAMAEAAVAKLAEFEAAAKASKPPEPIRI